MIGLDMEMPTSCRECHLCIFYPSFGETQCVANNDVIAGNFESIPFEGRPEWCPLIVLGDKEVQE